MTNLPAGSTATDPYTARQLAALLISGGREKGPAALAAVHVLVNTSLDLVRAYQKGLIEVVTRPAHTHVVGETGERGIAQVTDWSQLEFLVPRGNEYVMVRIAGVFESGLASKLGEWIASLTPRNAKVVAEAVLIAAGMNTWMVVMATMDCPTNVKATL